MVYFRISPIGFDCRIDKNNCEKYPDFCKDCVKAQLENLGLNLDHNLKFTIIDSEEKPWTVSLAEFQIGGQHYYFNKEQSDVFRDLYDVDGIPHYFLFDKEGELVEKGSHLRPNKMMEKFEVLR